jgi:hypothetical protein
MKPGVPWPNLFELAEGKATLVGMQLILLMNPKSGLGMGRVIVKSDWTRLNLAVFTK